MKINRKSIVIISILAVFVAFISILFSPSQSEVVDQDILDAWCEQAWYDMITLKEGRYTDARLIGNILRGAC